jgi:heme oxygenase (biliverdin-IX-beta and delta-forming)
MLMTRLRHDTAECHSRAEHAVDLRASFSSRNDYHDLIARLHGFYSPLETALERFAAEVPELLIPQRRKTQMLEWDLRSLGDSTTAIATLDRSEALPCLDSVASAIGALYVLEGATLGGRVIARLLEKQLGVSVDTGGAFFASYGDRVDTMWQAFSQAAERCCDAAAHQDNAAKAAIATFGCFTTWIRREQRLPTPHRPSSTARSYKLDRP